MIRIFKLPEYSQIKVSSLQELPNLGEMRNDISWVDLQEPTTSQIREVEDFFGITFPTRQQQEEIETSSRYLENSGIIKINSTFVNIVPNTSNLEEHEMSFILTEKTLFTLRFFDSRVISETVKKIKQFPMIFANASKIFVAILEARTDFDADLMESVSKYVAEISNRLRIIIKDINSLIEHANFNFTRLEYLQNSFLGLLNIEQNKVIKTFTVVSLVFMPPTLIASIYGMNFHLMPELSSEFGYPIALCLMFVSSIIPLAIFKRKKWL